jgi:hypothetical protein
VAITDLGDRLEPVAALNRYRMGPRVAIMIAGRVLGGSGLTLALLGLALWLDGRTLPSGTLISVGVILLVVGLLLELSIAMARWFCRLRVVEYRALRDVNLDEFGSELRQHQYGVIHFLGHGSEGKVCLLSDDHTKQRAIDGEAFGKLIAGQDNLRLVVFSACHSAQGSGTNVFAGVAPALVRESVPAVVAMQYPTVQVDTAGLFSDTLYESLATGQPIEMAVNDARNALAVRFGEARDWSTPVLYLGTPGFRLADPRRRGGRFGPVVRPFAAWIRPAIEFRQRCPGRSTAAVLSAVLLVTAFVSLAVLWPETPPDCDLFARTFLPEMVANKDVMGDGQERSARGPMGSGSEVESDEVAGVPSTNPPNRLGNQRYEAELAGLNDAAKPEVLSLRIAYVLAMVEARKPSNWRNRPVDFDVEALCRRSAPFHVLDFHRFVTAPQKERDRDPLRPFYNVLRERFVIEVDRERIVLFENHHSYFEKKARTVAGPFKEESSYVLSPLRQSLDSARVEFLQSRSRYMTALQQLKSLLGLSGCDVVPDVGALAPFQQILSRFSKKRTDPERWFAPRRDQIDIPVMVDHLPNLLDPIYSSSDGSGPARRDGKSGGPTSSQQRLKDLYFSYDVAKRSLSRGMKASDDLFEEFRDVVAGKIIPGDWVDSLIIAENNLDQCWRALLTQFLDYQYERTVANHERSSTTIADWESYFLSIGAVPRSPIPEPAAGTPPPLMAPSPALPIPTPVLNPVPEERTQHKAPKAEPAVQAPSATPSPKLPPETTPPGIM